VTARVLRPGTGRRLELNGRVATELIGATDEGAEVTVRIVAVAPEGEVARPLHVHEGVAEVVYVRAGRATLHHDEGTEPVEAGDCVYIPAGERHKIAPVGDEPLELVCVFAVGDLAARTREG
jgi:mannose-6-phosphate isomerase-like protein (cupin superfamily)